MVSDASSGPPHFHEEEPRNNNCSSNHCYCYFCCNGNAMCACSASTAAAASALANNGGKKRRIVELEHKQRREVSSLMDDTASSPLFNLPKVWFFFPHSLPLLLVYYYQVNFLFSHFGFVGFPLFVDYCCGECCGVLLCFLCNPFQGTFFTYIHILPITFTFLF